MYLFKNNLDRGIYKYIIELYDSIYNYNLTVYG